MSTMYWGEEWSEPPPDPNIPDDPEGDYLDGRISADPSVPSWWS